MALYPNLCWPNCTSHNDCFLFLGLLTFAVWATLFDMAYKISNIYVITAFLVIGGLLQGFDISSLSAILSTKPFKERFDSPTADQQGGITASISGGSFLGCLVNMFVVDRFGRRHTLMAGCIIFIFGSIICTASIDIAMLIVGRLLCGGAVGKPKRRICETR